MGDDARQGRMKDPQQARHCASGRMRKDACARRRVISAACAACSAVRARRSLAMRPSRSASICRKTAVVMAPAQKQCAYQLLCTVQVVHTGVDKAGASPF